jgi:endonuclease/exonuclease/phosphatase family metal-dependent hydrolase
LDTLLKFKFSSLLLIVTFFAGCSMLSNPDPIAQRTTELKVQYDQAADRSEVDNPADKPTIKVLSLNMAHGRKDSFTQFFVDEAEFHQNLVDIAEFLKRENADIVTLQEADAPSSWSGNFNHVEFLAREAGYSWYTHAIHIENVFGTYGTAVLSRFPIVNGYGIDFNPTPPTPKKGFTLAEIEWKPKNGDQDKVVIDVISVHLDFSRSSKRIEQIEDMTEILGERNNPAIVLGDFNSSWVEGEREIQELASKAQLSTHLPEESHLFTYFDDRFDWILISEEFSFCNYYTATDILSDHLAVVSELVPTDDSLTLARCDL